MPNFTDRIAQGFGTRGSVGSYLNESLPNIASEEGRGIITSDDNPSKDIPPFKYLRTSGTETGGAGASKMFGFDASLSSSTYKDNAPVQQNATIVLYCVKY